MKFLSVFAITLVVFCLSAYASGSEHTVKSVTHTELQAVDSDGVGSYKETDKVTVTGIILNNPEYMLDPTPGAPDSLGGQWQIVIQGEEDDYAGTAVWIGQYYSRVGGSDDYTNEEFLSHLESVNRDQDTGYLFSAGDRVEVTGFYKFFRGKTNINENHEKDDFFNFEIKLLKPSVGLPRPEVITLNDVMDNNGFIFDQSRETGAERYQARLVRVDNVTITDCHNWGPGGWIEISDGNLSIPVRLGRGSGFSRYPCPAGQIDIIGIFNQEDRDWPYDEKYHIWVTNYDGNGLVLTDRGQSRGNLPGDIDGDFKVDIFDFAIMSENWLQTVPGLY